MILGDYNGNGSVGPEDAQNTLIDYTKIVSGQEPSILQSDMPRVDVNGDGNLTVADAQSILTYASNEIAGVPVWFDDIVATGVARKIFAGYYYKKGNEEEFYYYRTWEPDAEHPEETGWNYHGEIEKISGAYYRDLTEGVTILWYTWDGTHFVPQDPPV